MRILFIRHGDPDYINDTLTKKGHREAKLLAERAADLNLGSCYVSPPVSYTHLTLPTILRV